MKSIKAATKLLLVAATCALSSFANAFPVSVTGVGQTFNINWLMPASQSGLSGDLGAYANFTVTAFNTVTDTVAFSVLIGNTSTDSNSSRFTMFGFQSNPDMPNAVGTGGWKASSNDGNNGGSLFDICMYSGQNCNGGGNTGLSKGQTANLTLTLSGVDFGNLLMLDHFSAKWQTGAGSFHCEASVEKCATRVPEPGSVSLLAAGMLGLVATRRLARKA